MELIKRLKEYWWLVTIICTIIAGIWSICWGFMKKNEEILVSIKTTQQMSLKSVIWNNEIPIAERASACDVYLASGYNSLTKKECEVIIEKGVEQGIF